MTIRGRTLHGVVVALCLPVLALRASPEGTRQGTGTIRGRVELPAAGSGAARHRPDVAALGTHLAPVPADISRAVVYLERAPRSAFDDEMRREPRARIDQRNETFVPRVLAILAGTTVDFPNSDRTYHNVFSLSRARPFDLGRYAAGRSKSVRFDRPGVVRVFCDIHSHMSAYILVFAHPYFASTDGRGHYRIEGVPPGSYKVLAWHEARQQEAVAVMPEAGGEVELNFTFPRP